MRIRELLIVAVLIGCGARSAPSVAPAPDEPAPAEPVTPAEPASPAEVTPPAPPTETASGPAAAGQPDGAACQAADECASGVCEGQGCDANQPGTCMARQRACTRDLRAYCGCDGVTFKTSGSCPGRRYQARGACPASTP